MYAIICSREDLGLIFYGPFTSIEAAERYAKRHKLGNNKQFYLLVRLHDSGEALDA
jgi:hypothetical protein